MGRKRKPYIDKKACTTYRLVHRSQQDPLAADNDADQLVLAELDGCEPNLEVSRLAEQREFGVYFDDEYNYLQHLKDRSEDGIVWEAVQPSKPGKVVLPISVLPSVREEPIGLLNLAAPQGLDLTLDPDVVAALDDDFDFDNPDNVLEDDFIALAEGVQISHFSEEDEDDYYGSDIDSNARSRNNSVECDFDRLSLGSYEGDGAECRFTEYSISSSVLPRNEGLTMLDDKFEQLFKEYDSLGAPEETLIAVDEEEREAALILQQLCEEHAKLMNNENDEDEATLDKRLTMIHAQRQDLTPDMGIRVSDDMPKSKHWDCDTILSTYSNIYNHPTQIKLPTKIKLNKKGLVIKKENVCDENENVVSEEEEHHIVISNLRTKNETLEEKRLRKQAVKENARLRRKVKKVTKEIYKEEGQKEKKLSLANSNQKNQIKL